MIPLLPIFTSIAAMAGDWLKGRRERSQVKLEGDLALSKAKVDATIDRMREQQTADIAWENLSITNSSWRDEWFTILLSIPMIMCFVPGGAQYVREGFDALNQSTPDWYQMAFLVAVASSFGFKKLADFMSLKKGA